MSTKDPMTDERLDAIQERAGEVTTLRSASFNDWQELSLHLSECVDDLLAEVERLRARPAVTDDMVERAATALTGLEPGEDWPSNEDLGGAPCETRDDEYWYAAHEQAREILDAALDTGEEA